MRDFDGDDVFPGVMGTSSRWFQDVVAFRSMGRTAV